MPLLNVSLLSTSFLMFVMLVSIPLSSESHLLHNLPPQSESASPQRIIVMNKMDLSNRSHLFEWAEYFKQQNCASHGVNSHNNDSVKQFLNFLQAQVRKSTDNCQSNFTATVMVVGIPNVGKSALCNALHQIGRISAAEKGKLRHATVSPHPGDTKHITSYKIASHPNIYVLDTPGILPPQILDIEVCSKLALTGAIKDCLVGETEVARYFLAILNSRKKYQKWEKLSVPQKDKTLSMDMKQKMRYPTDHTQDFIVDDVRTVLCEAMPWEKDMDKLIELQLSALRKAFRVDAAEVGEDADRKVATKLLNLYRTGRLGHYTVDLPPSRLHGEGVDDD